MSGIGKDYETIVKCASNDLIKGTDRDDILYGYGGDDLVYGYDGDDILYGGSGEDTLSGGFGDDKLYGDENDDVLYIREIKQLLKMIGKLRKQFFLGRKLVFRILIVPSTGQIWKLV